MREEGIAAPDSTAVRTALWRALHAEVDAPPHAIEDQLGLRLAAPEEDWRSRPDMDPAATRLFRGSIVARARFVEDLVAQRAGRPSANTSFWGRGWIRLRSAGRRWPRGCECSKWTGRVRRRGSGSG